MEVWINIFFILLIIVSIVTGLWRYKLKPYYAKKQLQFYLSQHPMLQAVLQKEQILFQLYQDNCSLQLSVQERKRLQLENDAFIYGEIEFLPFYNILEKATPHAGEVFYDLGSGSGKAVFVSALFFSFSKICGIEFLPALHDFSKSLIEKAKTENLLPLEKLNKICFIQGNFLEYDFSNGDIIFINATCLSYYEWEKLLLQFKKLKKGSRVIVTSKKIELPLFALIYHDFEQMSWGINSIFIYKKIH